MKAAKRNIALSFMLILVLTKALALFLIKMHIRMLGIKASALL